MFAAQAHRSEQSIKSGEGDSRHLRFGYATACNSMGHPREDQHTARFVPWNGIEIGQFGVFDGHKGSEVAEFLQQCIFDAIVDNSHFEKDPKRAIREAYSTVDSRILEMATANKPWRAGSTATTALLLDGQRLIVANVGDSRAVLSRAGQAHDVSVDHEPQKPEEREMVESKGGEVSRTIGGIYRVDKRLAMSRAFGDYDLKDHISAEPDIHDCKLKEQDDFLIVATDGLWHKVTSQEAVDIVQHCGDDVKLAAEKLVATALEKKETDDITVIVVFF